MLIFCRSVTVCVMKERALSLRLLIVLLTQLCLSDGARGKFATQILLVKYYIALRKINTVASLPHVDFSSLRYWECGPRKIKTLAATLLALLIFRGPYVALADKLLAMLQLATEIARPVVEQLIVLLTQDCARRRGGDFAFGVSLVCLREVDPPRRKAVDCFVNAGLSFATGRGKFASQILLIFCRNCAKSQILPKF